MLALQSTLRGLGMLDVDHGALQRDLDDAWEVLAEPIQTVMRREGHADAYERLKELTRGAAHHPGRRPGLHPDLDLPAADKQRLLALTPRTYIGLARIGHISVRVRLRRKYQDAGSPAADPRDRHSMAIMPHLV